MQIVEYFTDPILRAPAIGCMLMCVAASLIGVVLFLQKRLLVSESVSHAAYPGAVVGLIALALAGSEFESFAWVGVLAGALVFSWLGIRTVSLLQHKFRISADAALGFSLAVFFGLGVLCTSWLQGTWPLWAHQAETLLFGQVATLTDGHLWVYGGLALSSVVFVTVCFRSLQTMLFDQTAKSRNVERAVRALLLLSIVVGIRSVGVILVSGMLIAPAVAARQCAHRLGPMFVLSAVFGLCSGFLGNVLSVEMALHTPGVHLPTGPAIVLVSTLFALVALLAAPKRGVLVRFARKIQFHLRCREENLLKELWKKGSVLAKRFRFVNFRLIRQGWVVREGEHLRLTEDGKNKAAAIVRLHRLWELYLTQQLGIEAARVHRSAEEMEHILTPELEERLTRVLANPQKDPHAQPIPPRRQ